MLLRGLLPKLHPHVLLGLALLKLASIALLVGRSHRAEARRPAAQPPGDAAGRPRRRAY